MRFPKGMRDLLKQKAADSRRSLNAEIIARLQQTLDGEGQKMFSMTEQEFRSALRDALDIALRENGITEKPSAMKPEE